jgi:large subunit ribosomal protein L21
MPGVVPGDILRLNRASSLGSRDYTLKGSPYLDERLFECRARVIGTEAEPMRVKEKTKRRNRRVNTVRSKHKFTILRIAEVKINDLEHIES